MDNVYLMNGLDRHAVTLDNLISKEANDITVFTYNNYSLDPSYYPNEDKSWWDLHWKEAVKWITAGILFVVGIILAIIPCTSCIGITMLKTGFSYGISGLLMGGIISGIVAAIQGNDILNAISDGLINGFIDGFILGSITGLITGSIGLASNCFKIETLVLCEEGYKRIEDIKVGDKVYAYDEKTKDKALKKVVRLFKNKTKKWIHIFADKEEIICTGEHPFYIKGRGFVKAESIFEKEEVILYNGNTSIISKIEIEYLEKEEETYNFEVEDYHTYYVSKYGVLVHNRCVREDLYRGGDDFTAQLKDVRLTKNGMVKPTHGVSLNSNLDELSRFNKISKVDSIPDSLKIIQRGSKLNHFEIVPKTLMSFSDYNTALKKIVFHIIIGG